MDIINLTAVELVSYLKKGQISAKELLEITLAHSKTVANTCNPFAVLLHNRARRAAQTADEQLAKGIGGPLCGLPVTIKDSQWLAGVPCANGSRTQIDFIPEQSSAAVKRLEDAGAVIFAKTTCPEFSLKGITTSSLYGQTSNPWHTGYTCGGSSGGAGAAVAAGAGALSLGGDGGGSIRIPAAFCGIVGFKPTYKAVPKAPCFPSWETIVSYGPMARNVSDARLMFAVLTGANSEQFDLKIRPETDPQPITLKGRKIIVSEDLGFAPLDDDVRNTFFQVVNELEAAGAHLIYDQPNLPSSIIAWATIAFYDAWSFQKLKERPLEGLEKSTLELMRFGASLTPEQFYAAEKYRETIYNSYMAMFERAGTTILLTPTLGLEAFKHGRRYPKYIGDTRIDYPWLDWAGFLYDANLIGMPACALPMGLGDSGLPISIQVLAPPGHDMEVLNISEQLENLIDWEHSPMEITQKFQSREE